MSLLLINQAEAQGSGTTVTTGNSGDARSQAWDEVVIGTNMTATFDNAHPLTGANAYKIALTSTATAITYLGWTSTSIGAPVRRMFGSFSYWSNRVPATSSVRTVGFYNSSTLIGYLSVTASGTGNIQFRSSADAAIGVGSTALAASTLYRVDFDVFFDATLGTGKARIFNAGTGAYLATDATFANLAFGTSAGCDHIRFGAVTANFSSTSGDAMWFDDIWVSDQPQTVLAPKIYIPQLRLTPVGQSLLWGTIPPRPDDAAAGGTTFTDSGAGSITLAGATTEAWSTIASGAGTVTLAGVFGQSLSAADSRAGTITIAGTDTASFSHSGSGSGTITLSGTATEFWQITYNDSGSGTITLGGSSSQNLVATDSRTGTVTLAGTKSESAVQTGSGSGTVTLSGTATELHGTGFVDSGSGTISLASGTTSQSAAHSSASAGSVVLSGFATESNSGDFSAAGSHTHSIHPHRHRDGDDNN